MEISEIGIRLAVADAPAQAHSHGGRGPGSEEARLSRRQTEELVELCVLEVLRTLRMLEAR